MNECYKLHDNSPRQSAMVSSRCLPGKMLRGIWAGRISGSMGGSMGQRGEGPTSKQHLRLTTLRAVDPPIRRNAPRNLVTRYRGQFVL